MGILGDSAPYFDAPVSNDGSTKPVQPLKMTHSVWVELSLEPTPKLMPVPLTCRFLADGPPSGGIVQSSPQAGYAVTNSFSGTTFAWYDEDVPCHADVIDAKKLEK